MGAMASQSYWAKRGVALAQGRRMLGECPGLRPWHLRRLYAYFRRADKDDSDWISVLEFLMFFDVERSVFAVKAFTSMDADGDQRIDFSEFVRATWSYAGLREFAFHLYDLDGSGHIERFEVEAMVHELYGSTWKDSRLARDTLRKLSAPAPAQKKLRRTRMWTASPPARRRPPDRAAAAPQARAPQTDADSDDEAATPTRVAPAGAKVGAAAGAVAARQAAALRTTGRRPTTGRRASSRGPRRRRATAGRGLQAGPPREADARAHRRATSARLRADDIRNWDGARHLDLNPKDGRLKPRVRRLSESDLEHSADLGGSVPARRPRHADRRASAPAVSLDRGSRGSRGSRDFGDDKENAPRRKSRPSKDLGDGDRRGPRPLEALAASHTDPDRPLRARPPLRAARTSQSAY
ncbi:Ca2-binding protein [Aureococcus anophagefferens]|nr:Ca2-binding protein [Aureococcus anophagefferens]